MSMMKTNLTIITMCPRERFTLYKSSSRIIHCYIKDWATLLHLCYTCYLLTITNYLNTKLYVIDNFSACRKYLAKIACHFHLLLIGFDTLTYRKDYDRPPILVGHQGAMGEARHPLHHRLDLSLRVW